MNHPPKGFCYQWFAGDPVLPAENYYAPTHKSNLQVDRNGCIIGNVNRIKEQFHREVNCSPKKYEYKEVRKLEIDSPQKAGKKKVQKRLDSAPSSSSSKTKMDVFLEKFDEGVFVTKMKFGGQVRWKHVKRKLQALEHHPAIKYRKTVETAVHTMKIHKTIQVSLTEGEAMIYKSGQFFEGAKPKQKPKPKAKPQQQKVNVKYETNYIYNSGPSCSRNNQDDDESSYSSGEGSYYDDDNVIYDDY